MARQPTPSGDPGALLGEAVGLHRAGRLAEADEAYARLLLRWPAHPEGLRLRGILARQRGDPETSARWLRAAAAAAPHDADAPAELGLSYLAAGYLNLADRAFRLALARDPSSIKARANLGALCLYRGHLDEAIRCHRQVLEATPEDLEVRCNLANALAEAGRGGEALAMLEDEEVPANGSAVCLAARGAVLVSMEQYAAAARVLEHALALQPADDLALINLAYARRELGEKDAALAVLERAVAVNPDNARATADLIQLLADAGRHGQALDLGRGFLARHGGERLVLAAHACALRVAGREDEARALLDLDRLVVVRDLPEPGGPGSLASLNAALRDLLLADPTLLPGPRGKSTRQGLQTGELDPDAHAALATWRDLVKRAVLEQWRAWCRQGLAGHPAMAPAGDQWTLRAWGTVLEAGGYQTAHLHPLGWLSGVYYVECPDGLPAGRAVTGAGALEFGSPPQGAWAAVPHPHRRVEPRPGRLVLFPSYFYHRTLPFAGAGRRISLAFDVMPLKGPTA